MGCLSYATPYFQLIIANFVIPYRNVIACNL